MQAQPSITPDWVNNIGLDNGSDEVRSVAVDASGNVYITGSFQGLAVDFDPGAGTNYLASYSGSTTSDIFLAKYNSSGSLVWAFGLGGSAADVGYNVSISGDYVYLTGVINGTSAIDMDPSTNTNTITGAGSTDAFVAKYTSSLTPTDASFYQWAFAIGGTGADAAYQVVVSGTDIYFCGSIFGGTAIDMDPSTNTNTITGAGANNDGFVAKYNGNFAPSSTSFYTWAFRFGRSTASEIVYSIAVASNNIYIAGQLPTSAGSDLDPSVNTYTLGANGAASDIVIAKYDASLDPTNTSFFIWAFRAGGTTADIGYKLANSGDDLYVTGVINGTTAIDMDPSTNTNSITGAGSTDIFVAKYDGSLLPSNTSFYQWAFRAGSTGADVGYDIFLDGTDLYISGSINGTAAIDMDPSTNTNNITGQGANDAFVAKYDASIDPSNTSFYLYSFALGGTANDVSYAAALESSNFYLVGSLLSTTMDMDPSGSTVNIGSSSSTTDGFIGKYSTAGAYSNAFSVGAGGGSDAGSSITVDASGNVYAVGTFRGENIDFDPSGSTSFLSSSGGTDIYVVKYNSSGALEWAFKIGGTGSDAATSIKLSGTDIYVSGSINGTSAIDMDPSTNTNNLTGAGNDDIFVVKYDGTFAPSSTSFYQWAFKIGNAEFEGKSDFTINGNDLYLVGWSISTSVLDLDPSGNTNTVINGTSSPYVFLAKYDLGVAPSSAAFYQWGFNTELDNNQSKTIITINGTDIVLTSTKQLQSNTVDIDPSVNTYTITGRGLAMVKYDGNFLPSSTSFFKWGWCSGNLDMVNGSSFTDALLDGNYLYVSGAIGYDMDIDPSSNSYNIGGSICGFIDACLIKYDISLLPSNTSFYQWAFTLSSTSDCIGGSNESINSIKIVDDDLYVFGYIDDTPVDVDPSANTSNLTPTSSGQAFCSVYKKNLSPSNTFFYQWGFIPTGGGGFGNEMAVDAIGDLYITGSFYGESVDFDPTAGTLAHSACLTGTTTTNAFVGKYASGVPLPIELTYFNAEAVNNTMVNVSWETASEKNNSHFVVEKTKDGEHFSVVGVVEASGNSSSKINYSTIDSLPYLGISYYRLKQVDYDGKYSYSNLVAVDIDYAGIYVYPNPATNSLNIKLEEKHINSYYEIECIDMLGRCFSIKNYYTENNTITIYKIDIPDGVYTLKILQGDTSFIQRIIISQ
ncbi:MAG: T9SS type A sorting domain-containing protein [Bacteroidetes bacterium]|nr:T9SS type A sorting domain-containing protein [Bacteroidota bacterium]